MLRVAMADSPPSQSKNPGTDAWEGYNVDMAEDSPGSSTFAWRSSISPGPR